MSKKLHIPDSKPIAAIAAGSTEKAVKDAGATTGKLYRVPIAKIKLIPGFNVRVDSEDYTAHRDQIAASIRENGYDETKPLAGYVGKDGDKNVIFLTDGHTRLDAVALVNADPDTKTEDEIDSLPVIVRRDAPSMTDLTVALHTSNTGRPLTPFELGVVVKRLLAEDGADKGDIARRLAVTPRYLDDVLLLADSPAKVRNHVLNGTVSSTMAIQELRRNASEAGDRIEAAVKKATGSGKRRATAKDVGPKLKRQTQTVSVAAGDNMKELVKNVAAMIREAIPATGEGDDKSAERVAEIKLVIGVEAPPKAKKTKAKKTGNASKKKADSAPADKGEDTKSDASESKPKKRGKKAKPAAEEPKDDDLGVEGAEALEDGDLDLPKPPAVKGEGGDEEVDI